jgi:type IV secretory pathway VirB10-like protein
MKNKRIMISVLGSLFIVLGVLFLPAQNVPNVQEKKQDKKAIVSDVKGVADDRRDLDRLSDLIIRWDRLRKSSLKSTAIQQVEGEIATELRRDLKETAIQEKQAKAEIVKSTAEVKQARKEVRREKTDSDRNRKALRDDKRDLRNDKKDLRDDIRDDKKEKEILDRKKTVAKELIVLQKQIDAPGKAGDKVLQQKQSKLLDEYLVLSRQEVELGIREVVEDRQELREDRRETREDRR